MGRKSLLNSCSREVGSSEIEGRQHRSSLSLGLGRVEKLGKPSSRLTLHAGGELTPKYRFRAGRRPCGKIPDLLDASIGSIH